MFSKKVRVDVIAIRGLQGTVPRRNCGTRRTARKIGRAGRRPQGLRDLDRPDGRSRSRNGDCTPARHASCPDLVSGALAAGLGLRRPRAGPRRRHDRDAAPAGGAATRRRRRRRRPTSGPAAPAADPDGYDWNAERRHDAERRREHARQHEAGGRVPRAVRRSGVPARRARRAARPARCSGRLVGIDDVPGGIRATFADAKRVPTAIAEMRCHYAYARSRHFDEAIGCPLYVQAIEIRQGLDPRAIEIVARDEKTARLIRERGRQQAIFSRQATR